MHVSREGLEAIKRYELLELRTYRCRAGVLTIGYGHTGDDVVEGLEWTQEQAEQQLVRDVAQRERVVEDAILQPMTQGQFDALVCLCFNIGNKAFRDSTLVKCFNQGNVAGAGRQFVRWNKAAGKVDEDLLLRRAGELWTFARATP